MDSALIKGFQSGAYKNLLAQQAADDKEREAKLEELRRKKLREDIKRKRDEEDARKRAQLAKEERQQEAIAANAALESLERKKQLQKVEAERKRPLSAEEAKARRERADAQRNATGLSKARQPLPNKTLSTKYSSLLAAAPTKLDPVPTVRTAQSLSNSSSPRKAPGTLTPTASIPTLPKSRSNTDLSFRQPAARPSKMIATSAQSSSRKDVKDILQPRSRPTQGTKLTARNNLAITELVPLQKVKRDMRTIEEIQNDIHRQKGKRYAHLQTKPTGTKSTTPTVSTSRHSGPSPMKKAPAKRPRAVSSESDDSFVARPSGKGQSFHGESIWDILNPGKKRDLYLARDMDSDEDMEANADDIRREEQRALKAAKLEDDREAQLLREQEARKAAAKKKRLLQGK